MSSRSIKTDAASTYKSARDEEKSVGSKQTGSECAGPNGLASGGNDSAVVLQNEPVDVPVPTLVDLAQNSHNEPTLIETLAFAAPLQSFHSELALILAPAVKAPLVQVQ